MQKIIVTNISDGIVYYPELADWVRTFDYDPDDENFDALCLLEGDPDIIKYDGWRMYFIDVDLDGVKYILTSDEVDDKAREMLTRFHDTDVYDTYYESAEDNTWRGFEALPEAIAYRGGQGYYYGINKYKN